MALSSTLIQNELKFIYNLGKYYRTIFTTEESFVCVREKWRPKFKKTEVKIIVSLNFVSKRSAPYEI